MAFVQSFPAHTLHAFELKGRMMMVSVLRVLTSDLDALRKQLDGKIAAAPGLFQNFPVLLDFEELPEDAQRAFDIARLNHLLRERSVLPVGLRGAGDVLAGIAAGVGIGVIAAGATPEAARRERMAEAEASKPANLLIRHPVRSGQQIYAHGGDLVVLATVSPGAEILADGNIHVYGSLRGRALAGVRGNDEARIFCRSLDAELVAVAGNYRVSDNFQEIGRGNPVQIYLRGDTLVIETL
jgi:septum site-determining protein MinC